MTTKLTTTQNLNLLLLSNKRHIEICTSVGRAFGNVLFPDGENPNSFIAALNTFFSWGYFDQEERFYHGLRYSRLTINDKGKKALLDAEVMSE
ncbi:hypothetical protein [Paraglaciecola sp.]|uniref:hypothetical protein n=1 Tax=Paraglaciecola sp. TaxID=1920173 RepID=UPI0032653CF6